MKKINEELLDFISDKDTLLPYVYEYYTLPLLVHDTISILKTYHYSTIFHNKVTKKEAPDYFLVIKKPMDFGTIQKKTYKTYNEFKDDLNLIWDNCMTYNTAGYYTKCASIMRNAVENIEIQRIRVHKDVQYTECTVQVHGVRVVRHKQGIRIVVCKVLKECGYEVVSKQALDILVCVLEYKICECIREVCDE